MKPASGVFYRYNFNSRLSIKTTVSAANIAGDDKYSDNVFQRQRNLSFNSRLFEAGVQGEFNFKDFKNEKPRFNFSPYLLGGFSVFSFDPTTMYLGNKYRLQPLGTEGQGLPEYGDKAPYKLVSRAWVIGGGFKYRVSRNLSLWVEAANRHTHTDYLDDVSGQYANRLVLQNESGPLTTALADRSIEVTGAPVGGQNKMRGDTVKRDDYLFMSFGITFTINRYHCPFH